MKRLRLCERWRKNCCSTKEKKKVQNAPQKKQNRCRMLQILVFVVWWIRCKLLLDIDLLSTDLPASKRQTLVCLFQQIHVHAFVFWYVPKHFVSDLVFLDFFESVCFCFFCGCVGEVAQKTKTKSEGKLFC